MKKNLKNELQLMSSNELIVRAHEIRKEIFVLRMRKVSNPEKNTSIERSLRKSLACTLTFLSQKDAHARK